LRLQLDRAWRPTRARRRLSRSPLGRGSILYRAMLVRRRIQLKKLPN